MKNIGEQLDRMDDIKTEIGSAITSKGIVLPSDLPFIQYADLIRGIESDGGPLDLSQVKLDIIRPNLTSYTNNIGMRVTTNSEWGSGWEAWRSFSPDLNDSWFSRDGTRNAWIQLDIGKVQPVNRYFIFNRLTGIIQATPRSWLLQGSNNGVTFDTLDEQIDIDFGQAFNRFVEFHIGFNNYQIYRLHVLESWGNYIGVARLELMNITYTGPTGGGGCDIETIERIEVLESTAVNHNSRITALEHSGPGPGPGDSGPVNNIRLEPRHLLFEWFQDQVVIPTQQLFVMFSPPNADDRLIHWQSDNEDIAVVNEYGLVTPKGLGNCNIIATSNDGGFQDIATCDVRLPFTLGGTITLNEDGVPREFEILQRGTPNSDLYQGFESGVVLGRKNLIRLLNNVDFRWSDSTDRRFYHLSYIHSFLNDEYIKSFDQEIQDNLMTVRIPYIHNDSPITINSGPNGLLCKSFIISLAESGIFNIDVTTSLVDEGSMFEFYIRGITTIAINLRTKRNDQPTSNFVSYWVRTKVREANALTYTISNSGSVQNGSSQSNTVRICPIIVLPMSYVAKLKDQQSK